VNYTIFKACAEYVTYCRSYRYPKWWGEAAEADSNHLVTVQGL